MFGKIIILFLGIFTEIAFSLNYNDNCYTPANFAGACILPTECKSIRELIRKPYLTQREIQYINLSKCGRHTTGKTLVCCPLSDLAATTTTTTTTTFRPPFQSNQNQAQNLNFQPVKDKLPEPGECGAQIGDRIIGGEKAGIDEYPWSALIQYQKPFNQFGYHCGGSLISSRYVLTAGHCIKAVPKTWSVYAVRLGENDLESNPDCIGLGDDEECADAYLDVLVEGIIVHEQYHQTPIKIENDIALLQMAESVEATDWIMPICLPDSRNVGKDYKNKNLFVAGWGKTENETQSRYKLKLTIRGVSLAQCQSVYQKADITDEQICAGGEAGKDACRGDSGGPLMDVDIRHPKGPTWFLIGIVSFGKGCATAGIPGVYTRVDHYENWIKSKIL
uniref:CLIP domain-containing serine protease n=1 Tax=Corethrella appendiculata TaxID=1370023 RepID=U5EYA6_9DIPT